MKRDELIYSVNKLKSAFARLKDSVSQAVDELDRDGTIQRFEFTFELFWKSLKAIIVYEGFDCAGPRSCIKEGARRGFLRDGEVILDMLEDRNKTSHIYDEATAREIFDRIKQNYIRVIEENIGLFEQYIAKQE